MANFKAEVEKNIALLCKRMGYKKKNYVFIKDIDSSTYGTLSFGLVTHQTAGHIFVNVIVGISKTPIEEIHSKLLGYPDTFMTTVGTQIGYLMPGENYKEWDIVEGKDNVSIFSDIQNAIETFGIPYQLKMTNVAHIEERYLKDIKGNRDKYLPIIYYLQGDKSRGQKMIEEVITRDSQPMSEEKKKQLQELAGPNGQVFVGSGYNGKVDPTYLKFAENYKKLP